MFNVRGFAATLLVAAVSTTSFGQVVSAQSNGLIRIGSDSSGNQIFYDSTSIKGHKFNILKLDGDEMHRTTLRASCGDYRLFADEFVIYNTVTKRTREASLNEEIKLETGSSGYNAMQLFCRQVGARGWNGNANF